MSKCLHYGVCERESLSNLSTCILHAPLREKRSEGFIKALNDHREEHGDNFRYFVFPGDIRINEVRFKEGADFRNVKFENDVRFKGSIFEGPFRFSTRYDFSLYFEGCEFNDPCYFSKKSEGGVDFSGCLFDGYFLSDINIDDKFSITGTIFNSLANLRGLSAKELIVRESGFEGPVNFREVEISQKCELSLSEFNSTAGFIEADLGNESKISAVRFNGDTIFSRTKFGDETYLNDLSLLGDIQFKGEGPYNKIFSGKNVEFKNMTKSNESSLTFKFADFSRIELIGSDLTNVKLTGIEWPKNGKRIYDEVKVEGGESGTNMSHCELSPELSRIYRELRINYEENGDYGAGSPFHYREKANLQKSDIPRSRKLILWLYWLFGGYGEGVAKPLLWLIGLIVVGACLYIQLGVSPKGTGQFSWSCAGVLRSLNYSIEVSFFLRQSLTELGTAARFIKLIQNLFTPIFAGLLALAVRRRVRR